MREHRENFYCRVSGTEACDGFEGQPEAAEAAVQRPETARGLLLRCRVETPVKDSKNYPSIRVTKKLFMNTASKLGPHTQTDRGTCPGVGL